MNPRKFGFPQMSFAPAGEGAGAAASAPAPSASPAGGGSEAPSDGSVAASSSPPAGASPSQAPGTEAPVSGAPAPSSSPSLPASDAVPPADDPWGALEGLDTDELDLAGLDPAAKPAEVVPAVPPVQAQPPQPPVAAPAPAPTAQPATPPAPATGPQEAAPPIPSPAEPGKIADLMTQDSAALIEHLAQNEFKLSPADVEAIETDVVAHIPKLLAKVFVQSQASMLKQMQRVVPAMLQSITKVSERNAQNAGKFYSRWPDISKETHGQVVDRLAATYRQMNPTVPLEQMIEDLGPIVMMAAKIQPGVRPNGSAGAPASARPGSPPPPFRPALGGSAAPPQSGNEDPWMGLAPPDNDE